MNDHVSESIQSTIDSNDVVLFMKANQDIKFKQLIDITVVDYPEKTQRFKIIYLFLSQRKTRPIIKLLTQFSALMERQYFKETIYISSNINLKKGGELSCQLFTLNT